MVTKFPGNVREAIREFIGHYPDLDRHARDVIERIAGSATARNALADIAKTAKNITIAKAIADTVETAATAAAWQLIELCIRADWVRRSFDDIKHAQSDYKRNRRSIDDLRAFVDKTSRHPADAWRAWEVIPKSKRERFLRVFNEVAWLIDREQEMTAAAMRNLAASQKSEGKIAAENAGIGQLADGVASVFGRPFSRQVVELVKAALDIKIVTENRVREVVRARDKRSKEVVRSAE